MSDFFFLIPIALSMGVAGLCAFLWALRSGQYEDLEGAAVRILIEEEAPAPRDEAPASDADTKPQPNAAFVISETRDAMSQCSRR